jgi:ABC-type uncharacterized transport system substrate-binding protein
MSPHRRRLVAVCVLVLLAALAAAAGAAVQPSRILVIDSYHATYPWSAGIRAGIAESLGLSPRVVDEGETMSADGSLVVHAVFMDTKRHGWAENIAAAGHRAYQEFLRWGPDLVIACDDNAVGSVVAPYLAGGDVPVVFCGVNWDAAVYGLPRHNVTGMVEVDQVSDLVAVLRRHAKGDRIGLLLLDSVSARRDAEAWRSYFGLDPLARLVGDYAQWKAAFVAMQDEVDMLLIKQNVAGAADWDERDAVEFALANTRIPVGTTGEPMMGCALVSFIKNPHEQGRWAGATARSVLAGADPRDIPVAVNTESRVFLNMTMAKKLGIRFSMDLIERATFLEERWAP